MTAHSLEQQAAPERRLDNASHGNESNMPALDRVALLKDHKPSEAGLNGSLPALTLADGDNAYVKAKSDAHQPLQDSKQQSIENAKKVLEAPDSSIKQKMEAISSLHDKLGKSKDGLVHFSLNDGGKTRDFAIGRETVGKGVHLLHLYARDESGKSHPVLRGVERHGQIEQQRHQNGSRASYVGDWWSSHGQDSSVSRFSGAERAPQTKPHQQPASHVVPPIEGQTPAHRPPHQQAVVPIARHSGGDNGQPYHPQIKPGNNPPETASLNQDNVYQQPDVRPENSEGRVVRTNSDRSKFYTRQDDAVSCSAIAVAMLDADQRLGRPVQLGPEAQRYKQLTGTIGKGYRGSLETMANQIHSIGLDAKAYDYGFGNVGQQAIKDLNHELDQGHSAVARVINPHTGNPHYIYIAGRDESGKYIIGDPDRKNTQHFQPITAEHLQNMMHERDGFVAGWNPSSMVASNYTKTPG